MNLRDIFTSEAIASHYTEEASNREAYLGAGLFPSQKKNGLDLKWIRGHKGLPVSLMPSTFDAKSTLRDRVGIGKTETEMPFFRESILVKERDEQEIMRVQDSNDPYADEVLDRIFDDVTTLVDGADVVPERMRMQLLAPIGGKLGIEIKANGVNYTYNYDPTGEWKKGHYTKTATRWSSAADCDPVADLEAAMDKQEDKYGTRPKVALMSKATFNLIKNSAKVRSGVLAQNTTANLNYTTKIVRSYIEEALDITIVIYNKSYKDESGKEKKFYPDNIIMLLPDSSLGSTWYGTTPEERTLMGSGNADVTLVNTGIAVAVTVTEDPVNTKTTVSEIVLPSFERVDECAALEVAE